MIELEHHLDFCQVGISQSEQRMSKFCIHVFHQLVFFFAGRKSFGRNNISGGFPFIIPIMSEELRFKSFVVMRCWSFEVCNDDVFESLVKSTADDVPVV